jgi:hypothetical protein
LKQHPAAVVVAAVVVAAVVVAAVVVAAVVVAAVVVAAVVAVAVENQQPLILALQQGRRRELFQLVLERSKEKLPESLDRLFCVTDSGSIRKFAGRLWTALGPKLAGIVEA